MTTTPGSLVGVSVTHKNVKFENKKVIGLSTSVGVSVVPSIGAIELSEPLPTPVVPLSHAAYVSSIVTLAPTVVLP